MKRILSTILFIALGIVLNAQTVWDDLDFSPFRYEEKEVPLHNYNDEFFKYVSGTSNPQLYQKVNDAVNKAQNGVRIETSSYSQGTSSSNHVTYQQAQQIKKAQQDAKHRAWLEQRRAQQAQAAEQARLRNEREKQRKEAERHRRYIQAYNTDINVGAGHYQRQHDQITYNVTEGHRKTMVYQPEGSQPLQSQYTPIKDVSPSEIVGVVPKGGGTPVYLSQPVSSLTIQYTDYELEFQKASERNKLTTEVLWTSSSPSAEEIEWDEFQKELTPSHSAALNYFLTNGKVVPNLYGINGKGQFVFETNNTNKLYVVSPDGLSLTIYSFEEHAWDDDNIINKIKNEELKDFINETFEFDYPKSNSLKSGKVKFENLKDLSPEELKKLLPQIKAKMKMTMVDNSTTLSCQRYSFNPQPISGTLASFLTNSYVNETEVVSIKGQLSGGGKAEAKIDASAGLFNNPSYGAAVKFSALEAGASASQGSVVAIGNQSYLFNVKGDAKIGAGISYKEKKTLGQPTTKGEWGYEMEKPIFPGIYAGGGINVEVKNITMKAKQAENEDTSKD